MKHTINAIQKANLAGKIAASSRTQFIEQLARQGLRSRDREQLRPRRRGGGRQGRTRSRQQGRATRRPAGVVSHAAGRAQQGPEGAQRRLCLASRETSRGSASCRRSSRRRSSPPPRSWRRAIPVDHVQAGAGGQDRAGSPPGAPAGSTNAAPKSSGRRHIRHRRHESAREREHQQRRRSPRPARVASTPIAMRSGGPNKALVVVSVSAAEVAAFRKRDQLSRATHVG